MSPVTANLRTICKKSHAQTIILTFHGFKTPCLVLLRIKSNSESDSEQYETQ